MNRHKEFKVLGAIFLLIAITGAFIITKNKRDLMDNGKADSPNNSVFVLKPGTAGEREWPKSVILKRGETHKENLNGKDLYITLNDILAGQPGKAASVKITVTLRKGGFWEVFGREKKVFVLEAQNYLSQGVLGGYTFDCHSIGQENQATIVFYPTRMTIE